MIFLILNCYNSYKNNHDYNNDHGYLDNRYNNNINK